MIVKISRVKKHFPLGKWHSQTWISSQPLRFRKLNFKRYELWGKYNYITKRLRSSKNITLFRYMGHRFEVKLHIHQTPRLSFYVILNQVTWIRSKKTLFWTLLFRLIICRFSAGQYVIEIMVVLTQSTEISSGSLGKSSLAIQSKTIKISGFNHSPHQLGLVSYLQVFSQVIW